MPFLSVHQQHEFLRRLLSLTREQALALRERQWDTVMALLQERERLVKALNTLPDEPAPTGRMPFLPSAVGTDGDARATMRGLIWQILRQDEENERMLRALVLGDERQSAKAGTATDRPADDITPSWACGERTA